MRLVVLLAIACSLGCSGGEPGRSDRRAIVIAIDGADWGVIDAMTAAGDLPNLTRLQQLGVRAEIETLSDIPLSPAIWTSIATGKRTDEHGISWFFSRAADGTPTPVRSTDRRVAALWNILSSRDKRVGVVGWWATYPPEPVGEGVMVSDAMGYHGFGRIRVSSQEHTKVYPWDLEETLVQLVPSPDDLTFPVLRRFIDLTREQFYDLRTGPDPPRPSGRADPEQLLRQYAVTAQGYAAISDELLRDREFDLFMVYFEQIDSVSHLFMKYAPPKLEWIEPERYERYRNAVSSWYGYQDELIGKLLERVDLESTAVFVVSDHGFKSGDRRIRSDAGVDMTRAHLEHETMGVFVAAGPGIRVGERVTATSVLDVAPTLLYYLGLPIAEDMAGSIFNAIFTETNLAAHPHESVQTYETEIERYDPGVATVDPERVDLYLANLEALGYLGSARDSAKPPPNGSSQGSPQMLLNLGHLEMAQGEFETAGDYFEQALAIDPDNAEAMLGQGAIERVYGRSDRADDLVRQALEADPDSVMALGHMAELLRDEQRYDEAAQAYRKAIRISGGQPYLYIGLGDILQRSGRHDEALVAFDKALELDPDSYKAHYNLAVSYADLNRDREAKRSYETSLELSPESDVAADAYNNLGVLIRHDGDPQAARGRFEEAVRLSPFHFQARYNLALLLDELGERDLALQHLEAARLIEPNRAEVHLRLGVGYLRSGRGNDAYTSLTTAQRLAPDEWQAHFWLAVLHSGVGNAEVALASLQKAVDLEGDAVLEQARKFPPLAELVVGQEGGSRK